MQRRISKEPSWYEWNLGAFIVYQLVGPCTLELCILERSIFREPFIFSVLYIGRYFMEVIFLEDRFCSLHLPAVFVVVRSACYFIRPVDCLTHWVA